MSADWQDFWGGISIRWVPPDSPPWYSEQMAINLKTNRSHPNHSKILLRLAERWCKRHDRAVFAFGDMEHEGGVWAKVYPTDPRPSFQAFVELYKATGV